MNFKDTVSNHQASSNWGRCVVPDRLLPLIRYYRNGDLCLDFGCGRGAYTETLNCRGIRTIGVDITEYPEWSVVADHLEVSVDSIFVTCTEKPALAYANDTFDIVCAFEVLEHCSDVLSVTKELNRVCKRDFFCSVPDCGESKIYRNSLGMHHWTDRSHVQFFNRASLIETLQDSGFEIISIMGSSPLDITSFYWEAARLPKIIKKVALRTCKALKIIPPDYFVSILVHCRKKKPIV